jgi:hypothetical protein
MMAAQEKPNVRPEVSAPLVVASAIAVPPRPETLARFEALGGCAGPGPSTDAIMAATRGDD